MKVELNTMPKSGLTKWALPMKTRSLPLPKTQTNPQHDSLILTNQAGLRRMNPKWQLVTQVISELDTGQGNSFCCLEAPGFSYIQTLHGFNGYHLEWRESQPGEQKSYSHFRASYPGASSKIFELKKHDNMNSGEYRDLLRLEDVIDAFGAFYRGEGMPAWLEWRTLDI